MYFEISSETVDIDSDFKPDAIFENAPVQLTDAWSVSFDGHEDVSNVN